jgi:superfamily II DNA/RNA helicase
LGNVVLKFSEFGLEPELFSAVEKLNYTECTPVQAASMPHIFEGRDVSGLAQTGTGKTAAFLVPLIDRILKAKRASQPGAVPLAQTNRAFTDWKPRNFVLILVPTRELADQVYDNVVKLSEFSGLRGVSIYGGTGYEKQKEGFQQGVEFVVATPGRLLDLFKEHIVDLKQVRAIVFDEADRMFDMGFKDDMKYILQRVPRERQFLVFSATLNFDVLNTAYQYGANVVEVDLSRDQPRAENVKDAIFHVGHLEKPAYVLSLIKKHSPRQLIIFTNFKVHVEKLTNFLIENGYSAMAISSLLSQAQRNKVIELFKADNEKNILVATDVAARGLDIKGVDMVINYEMPNDAESYVHRIGRTGRAGADGQAFSLVCDRDVEGLQRVEEYLKHKLTVEWMDEQDLLKDIKPMRDRQDSWGRRPSSDKKDFRRDRPPRDRHPRRPSHDQRGPRAAGSGGGSGGNRPHQTHHQSRSAGAGGENQTTQSAQGGGQQQHRRPRPQGQGQHAHKSDNRPNRSGQRQHRKPHPSHASRGSGTPVASRKVAKPAGVVGKVTGFLKRLVGTNS